MRDVYTQGTGPSARASYPHDLHNLNSRPSPSASRDEDYSLQSAVNATDMVNANPAPFNAQNDAFQASSFLRYGSQGNTYDNGTPTFQVPLHYLDMSALATALPAAQYLPSFDAFPHAAAPLSPLAAPPYPFYGPYHTTGLMHMAGSQGYAPYTPHYHPSIPTGPSLPRFPGYVGVHQHSGQYAYQQAANSASYGIPFQMYPPGQGQMAGPGYQEGYYPHAQNHPVWPGVHRPGTKNECTVLEGILLIYTTSESSRKTSDNVGLAPLYPRGPPRKPKQSGYALWVGNLPSGTTILDLKDHFSRDATEDIESLFLISKSNCAFVNYRTEASCAAAMHRFHDGRFHGVRLVCRLRRGTGASAALPAVVAAKLSAPGLSINTSNDKESEPTIVEPSEESPWQEPAERPAMDARVGEKYFVVKSLTNQDLESSVRNGVWATQSHNEEALNKAFEVF